MRPREPNAEECKELLEDIRQYHLLGYPNKPEYPEAFAVLTAWLRHKAYWGTGNRNTKTEESEKA